MTTRLYFRESATPSVSPVFDPAWSGTTPDAVRRVAVVAKSGDAITTEPGTAVHFPNTAGVSAPGENQLMRQYVFGPLNGGQNVSGTVGMQLMMREDSNAHNVDKARVSIRVFSNDGSTLQGTPLALGQNGTTLEFTNQQSMRNVTAITGGTSLTTVACTAGDWLVIDIGAITTAGGGALGNAVITRAKWGDNATDLPVNDTQTTDGAGWIEFSATLSVGAIQGTTALTFSQTGSLKGDGTCVGTSTLTFAQTGSLKGTGSCVGTTALAFSQTGSVQGAGTCAGTTALTFSQTGSLKGAGTLVGTAALLFSQTGSVKGAGSLAGTSPLTFTASASLKGAGRCVGTTTLTFAVTGSLHALSDDVAHDSTVVWVCPPLAGTVVCGTTETTTVRGTQ